MVRSPHVTFRFRFFLFSSDGKEIRNLINAHQQAGQYKLIWDGRDNEAIPVASGTYFCRLETETDQETIRMLLIK